MAVAAIAMPETAVQRNALRLSGWLLIAGLITTGLIGVGTDMTWQWPGYLLIGAAAACAVFAGSWRQPRLENQPSRALPNACLVAAASLCTYVVWRAAIAPVTYFGREDAALAIAWFIVYALTATVMTSLRQRIALVKTLTLILAINLAVGFYQFSGHPEFGLMRNSVNQYAERIGGAFINPNHLAALLAAGVPLLASLLIFGRGRPVYRFLFALIAIMAAIGIGLTRSRGGLLAFGTGLAVFAAIGLPLAWFFWGRRLRGNAGLSVPLTAFGLIAVVITGLFYANGQALQQRFGANAFKIEANRQLFWQSALDQHADAASPWLGSGSRAFRYESRRLRPVEMHPSIAEPEFVHNDWLQMLADYGWIGVGLLLTVVIVHAGHALQFILRDFRGRFRRSGVGQNNQLALTLGAAAGLAALGAHALFDFHLHSPAVALWSALLFGLLAAPRPEGEPVKKRRHSSSRSSNSRTRNSPRSAGRSPQRNPSPPAAAAAAAAPLQARGFFGVAAPTRLLASLGGIALLIAGTFFARSEWHFEKARLAYLGQGSHSDTLTPLAHLLEARRLDPHNPFIHSLSGHAHLLAAHNEADGAVPLAVRGAYLKRAGRHLFDALTLYPQDINAMMGLAQVYDALNQHDDALEVLENARLWAPLYGNIAQMQAEQLHLLGRLSEAEQAYTVARHARAFGDSKAAMRGLALLKAEREGEFAPMINSADTVPAEENPPQAAGPEHE